MRKLNINECTVISGGNVTSSECTAIDSEGVTADGSILLAGTMFGLTGGVLGAAYGAGKYGFLGAVGGFLVGAPMVAVVTPLIMFSTAVSIGTMYHYLGFIDVDKL